MILDLYKKLPIGDILPSDAVRAFICLWEDGGVQDCYKRALEYRGQQLNDSAP